jgi:hypothetical protein
MKPARVRLRVPAPTVLQMMKLVVLGAVASSCLAFGVQLSKETSLDTWLLIAMEALLMPLATALVAFPLLRKGQLKDWLILALVATSVSVVLGIAVEAMVEVVRDRVFVRRQPLDYEFFRERSIAIVIMLGMPGLALVYLLKRIVPGRCPDCRRLSLLPEAKFRVRSSARQGRSYQCLGCRGQFRNHRGYWEAIPTDSKSPMP